MLQRWLSTGNKATTSHIALPDPENAKLYNLTSEAVATTNEMIQIEYDKIINSKTTGSKRRGDYNHYSSELRAKIAKFAIQNGINNAVKKFTNELGHKINESTVRAMKTSYLKVQKNIEAEKSQTLHGDLLLNTNGELMTLPKRSLGRPSLLGDLEKKVQNYIKCLRSSGGIINRSILLAAAKGIIMHEDKTLLKEFGGHIELTRGWAQSFLNRMNYCKRKGTKAARNKPDNLEEIQLNFLLSILDIRNVNNIPDDLIINWDQTGLKIVPVNAWTLAQSGSKQVEIIGLEDKREITALLCCSMAGTLLPPQILYTGKTDRCHPAFKFPNDWLIDHTENHWSNQKSMLNFLTHIIDPYLKKMKEKLHLNANHKALALFDVFKAHMSDDFKEALDNLNVITVHIPAGSTGELQPLDLSINQNYKENLKEQFHNWYADEIKSKLEIGESIDNITVDLRLSKLKPLHAKWLLTTHNKVSQQKELIRAGFGKAGILHALS